MNRIADTTQDNILQFTREPEPIDNIVWLNIESVRPMGEGLGEAGRPSRHQPRTVKVDDSLHSLAASIQTDGQLAPVVVREVGSIKKGQDVEYRLIAGERRWRAMRDILRQTRIKATVLRNTDARKAYRLAIIEQAQREDWNAVERAGAVVTLRNDMLAEVQEWLTRSPDNDGMKKLSDDEWKQVQAAWADMPAWVQKIMERSHETKKPVQVTREDLGDQLNLSWRTIANLLSIEKIPDDLKQQIVEFELTEQHAVAVASLPDKRSQLKLIKETVEGSLSTRQTQARANELSGRASKAYTNKQHEGANADLFSTTPSGPVGISTNHTFIPQGQRVSSELPELVLGSIAGALERLPAQFEGGMKSQAFISGVRRDLERVRQAVAAIESELS